MKYGFFETDRLEREARRYDREPCAMIMCPTCNRSIPDGMKCELCAEVITDRSIERRDDTDTVDMW